MIRSYRLVWGLLSRSERRRFVLLVGLTLLMSVFEVVGVAGILPFLSVLATPRLIETNWVLTRFAATFGLETPQEVKIGLGLAVFVVMLTSMAVRAVVTYAQIRFALMRSYTLSSRLLRGYLVQDYAWFLRRNSADLGHSLLSEVDLVIRESVLPAVLLISNTMILLLIGGFLFLVEPFVALVASSLLVGVYLAAYVLLRGPLAYVGRQRMEANGARFQVVQEVAGGLKEVKVMGLEEASLLRFRAPARAMAQYQTTGLVITKLPRFALETVVYGGFIVMVLVMVVLRGDAIADLLPLLGLLGMAATKIFPALQQFYQELSSIRFSASALQRLHDSLASFAEPVRPAEMPPLRLRTALEIHSVGYRYPQAERDTLQDFSATIPAHTKVGIVGGTGAGKTTVIDLILGLLTPDSGEIRVDGAPLTQDRVRAWQKNLGYVPQSIFLTDDTVAANIAFGQDPEAIDMSRVERAARVANLHDFVMRELPQGYRTTVGERGVRLSGGQRQRIGMARALYTNPDVLVLDEATSALDNLTERAIMEALRNLGREKTVIMIAHRLTTVQDCDTILVLDQGRLVAQGTYLELIAGHEGFRRMAGE